MRVGIDARLLYYQQGGISTYTRCLIRELVALREDEQYVILRSRNHNDNDITVGRGFGVAATWTPCHSRFEQITLPVELMPLGIDILHSPDFIPPLHRRCKSVITVHDLAFLKHPYLLTASSKSYYSQISRAVKSADAIITVSQSTRNDLIEHLNATADRIHVIPEAADPIFRPIDDRRQLEIVVHRYGIPHEFILFVGTIEPRKNLPVLLKAFAQLVKERRIEAGADRTPPKLVIVGKKGWLYGEVFATVDRLGIRDNVVFVGWVERADLPAVYNLASIMAMPSLYEGFGLPVLEAMACGTPVIASNISSLPEVAGQDAVLVDPLNVDEWAGAIERLSNDAELRRDLGRRGIRRAGQFSWRRMAEETRTVYEHVHRNEGTP